MAGFASRSAVLDALATKSNTIWFYKNSQTPEAIGVPASLWATTGTPGQGANPASTPGTAYAADPDSPITGAMHFPDKTEQKHLFSFGAAVTPTVAPGSLILYDRLVGVGSVDLATTGNKTINSTALTRYTGSDAKANEVWLEVSTATTVTAPVVSLASYTSSDGSNGLTGDTVTFPAVATNQHTLVQLPLNASEQGVRSVETLNVGTAATVGAANLIIIRRLATIHLPSVSSVATQANSQSNEVNFLDDFLALPRIYDKAALALAFIPSTGAGSPFFGSLTMVYG